MSREDLFGPAARIDGIVRFTGERAQQGYRLTSFLVSMRDPAARAAFAAHEKAAMTHAGLDATQQALVTARDYQGMIEHGASIYALGKAAGALGTTLVEMGAQARGMSAQQFVQHRRSQGAGA